MPKDDPSLKIVYLAENQLVPNPANPRLIKDDAFNRLVNSLKESPKLFDARPLLCSNRTGELIILAGNMRFRAAQELGYKTFPVIVLPGLTEDQENEIVIKDNGQTFGEWDYSMLANQWADFPLVDWGVKLPDDFLESKVEDYSDLDEQIQELDGSQYVTISLVVPQMYKEAVEKYLLNGENPGQEGMGRGLMRRAEII